MRKKKLNVGSHLMGEVTVSRKIYIYFFWCAAYNKTWSKILLEILGQLDSFSLAGVGQIM